MKNTKTAKKTSETLVTLNEKINKVIVMTKAIEYLVNESSARICDIESKLARQENQNTDISPPVMTTSHDKGYGVTWLLLGLVVGYIIFTIFTK